LQSCQVDVGCQGNLGAQNSKKEKKGCTSKDGFKRVSGKREEAGSGIH
jgi:hypothetical protein